MKPIVRRNGWKECSNCLMRKRVPNATTKCPNKCGGRMHRTIATTEYDGIVGDE